MCKCKTNEYEQQEKEFAENQRKLYINTLRSNGLQDRAIREMRFEADDGSNPKEIDKAHRYVAAWKKMRKENIGLLLWGNTGNGKTFTAGCIANALIDIGVPVMMTSIPRILNALNAMYKDDKSAYIESLSHYELLILDDLGAERDTSYSIEQVYTVIDSRYKAKKPLICTTNLQLKQLQKAENMDYQRIYDRVLEMCIPLSYKGESRRKDIAQSKMQIAAELLGG
jgi:DNA replication protein DnaC